MARGTAEVNSAVLLAKTLWDGNTGKGVRARVFDSTGAQVSGSPFTLTHRANGHYSGIGWTPTIEGQYSVSYEVYTTTGFTVIDPGYEWDDAEVEVRSIDQDLATLLTRLTSTRAGLLDNLDAAISTRATQTSVTAIDTKLGSPAAASVSLDIAAVYGRIGAPVGASIAVDIASIKTDSTTLVSRLTAGRAGNLDNLDATVSSRQSAATALSQYNALQADTDDIQLKIGTPVSTLASDIAGVQSTANAINTKLGTPAGASVSVDIAAIQTKLGTPAGASVSVDIAAIQTKLGTPAGANVSADIAAVKSDTGTLTSRLTSGRASNLDNLDAAVSSRHSTATALSQYNALQADTDDIQAKIGTPVSTLAADIAGVQTTANSINTKLGTPAGASVSVDIAALQTTINTVNTKIGTPVGASISVDIAAVQTVANTINTKLGTPGTSVSADIAAVQTTVNTVNTKIGTPVGASVSVDIAAIQTKLGSPAGVSVSADIASTFARIGAPVGLSISADIAAVKGDTSTLTSRLTSGRAANLDNLDAAVSLTQTAATALSQYNALQADTDDIQAKIGTPVSTVSADIAAVQTKLGTPAGASVSVDIAAVKTDTATLTSRLTSGRAANLDNLDATVSSRQSAATALSQYNALQADTDDIQAKIGTPVGASLAIDIAAVQTTANAVNTKLGSPAGLSVSADIAAVKGDTAAILTQTGTTGVAVSTASRAAIVDEVWDELLSGHVAVGSMGSAMNLIDDIESDTSTLNDTKITSGRAANLDNLNATITSRASTSDTNAIKADTAQLLAYVGVPGTTLVAALTSIQADTDDIQSKIGSPVSTIAADIAAVQTTANTINTKVGTPSGASVSVDIAAIFSRQGAPAGASMSADIAAIKSQTGVIESKIDDLSASGDSSLSIPQTFLVPATGSNVFRIYWRHFTTGIPSDPATGPDIAIQKSDGSDIVASTAMTKEADGVFYYDYTVLDSAETGIQVLVKIAYQNDMLGPTFQSIATANQTQSDSVIDDIVALIGIPATGTISGDILQSYTLEQTINTKIGTPVTSVSADIAAAKADTAAIKAKTDQFTFTSGNVHSNAQIVSDKTGYALSGVDKAALVDLVWDEDLTGHSVMDSASVYVLQAAANVIPPASLDAIADAVWDEQRSGHVTTGSFGVANQGVLSPARAAAIDNLDATISSRATQTSVTAIDTKLGVPIGVSVSADIAAVQADTDDIQARLGNPANGSVSADIASVKGDTSTLTTRLSAGRANNLDNLDATVSSRQSAATALTQYNDLQADVDDIQAKIGTPVSTLAADIAAVQTKLGSPAGVSVSADIASVFARIGAPSGASVAADIAAVQTRLGVPAGASVSADIASIKGDTTTLTTRLTSGRAANLDNLDATVSSRQSAATALSQYNSLQADVDDIQLKIGTPVSTLADDIAAVQTVSNSINTKIGTPVGASVSVDIAAVQSTATAVSNKLGTPVNGTVTADIAAVQTTANLVNTKIGTPLTSVSADIAGVQTTASVINTKIGTPAGASISVDIAAIQSTANTVNSKLGTPAGASVSVDIAAVKADTSAILGQTGTTGVLLAPSTRATLVDEMWDEMQSGHTLAGSFGKRLDADMSTRQSVATALSQFNSIQSGISSLQVDTDDIQSKIGFPANGSVSADIASLAANQTTGGAAIIAIKAKTDQLSFTSGNVNSQAQVVADKTGYALSPSGLQAVSNEIWDEPLIDHQLGGTTGEALNASGASSPGNIANAVWDASVAPHNLPNSFGNYVQVIRQTTNSSIAELTNGTHGLTALYVQAGNNAATIVGEVNQNETKINNIIPAINSSTSLLKAEIDENQLKIEALSSQLSGVRVDILNEIDQVETMLDALSDQVGTIQNNTTVRFIVPDRLIKPTTGTKNYQFQLRLYDETGNAQAPDSVPTIRIRRLDTGVDIVLNDPMTQDGAKVGAYYYNFSISAGSAEYAALVEATVVELGQTRYVPAVTEITEFESDLNAIQAQLNAVQGTVNSTQGYVSNGIYGLPALKNSQNNIVVEVNENEALLQVVKSQTDLIPAQPATAAQVAAVNTSVLTRPSLADITTQINLARDYIVGPDNRNVTAVYNKIDFTNIMKTNDPHLAYLDAAVSSRSTLDATAVWNFGSRSLTNFVLPQAAVNAIWDHLASQAVINGSLGKLIADNVNATISSRATAAQVTSALAGVAQESSVNALVGVITTGDNQTQVQVAAMAGDVSTIKGKTQNLPSDPVSASVVTAGFTGVNNSLANIDLKTTGVKSKTDNLPPDPAKETTVQQRPVNPVLASDVRISRLDVNVSTRSTLQPADIAGLATAAALANTQSVLTTEINQNETKLNSVQATLNLVKAKTDGLPAQPVSKPQLDAAVAEIINEIDTECSGGGGGTAPTVAEIWSYVSRTITQDPQSFGPDISNLATKQDVQNITVNTKLCRMSTTLNSTDNSQELIVWLENNGAVVTGASNARVKVKSTEGFVLWEANLATPSADGIFAFAMDFTPPAADRSYYVDMIINDGTADVVGREPFITVG